MIHEARPFALQCPGSPESRPVLTGVQATGRLDGVLFELTLRQTYRNAGARVLEVLYTFPLPHQAVLLGFACELNGRREAGTIVAKPEAERRYEAALVDGDAPVMLEALGDGMHTANIGNLKPGDEMVLEVRFAQLLAFEQGRLRICIPTTIAPRYGSADAAGLQPQQVPQVSLAAEYPLALSVTLAAAWAGASVECATHRFARVAVDGGLRLDLAAGAWLDRDVVIVLEPREPRPSLVIQAHDALAPAAPVVVMAALQPPPPSAQPRRPITLELLVDCSGSMGGDSIASARLALRGVLAGLGEDDHVGLSRFGSTVQHMAAVTACTPHALRRLSQALEGIDADLGGTEMEAALRAVFELPLPAGCIGADVLLLTDGEIWQAHDMIAGARASGRRIFAIGVGTSPAEGVLRALAEATGGACEFATPGEALAAAAARMLLRMRQPAWRDARVDWGAEPVWQTALPASLFAGDTVIAFAGLRNRAATSGVRLLAVAADGAATELARGEAEAPCAGDTLPRLAAAKRIAAAASTEATQLAVAYQLISPYTNCILVHERADADKAGAAAELHRVSSMLAAGWGASGTIHAMAAPPRSVAMDAPSMMRMAGPLTVNSVRIASDSGADFEMPAPQRKASAARQPATLEAIRQAVFETLAQGGGVRSLSARGDALELHADARHALQRAVELGLARDEAWLVLAHWASTRAAADGGADGAAGCQAALAAIDPGLVQACMKLFDRMLGLYANDSWTLSRTRRLRRALGRALP